MRRRKFLSFFKLRGFRPSSLSIWMCHRLDRPSPSDSAASGLGNQTSHRSMVFFNLTMFHGELCQNLAKHFLQIKNKSKAPTPSCIHPHFLLIIFFFWSFPLGTLLHSLALTKFSKWAAFLEKKMRATYVALLHTAGVDNQVCENVASLYMIKKFDNRLSFYH